jgi:diacylglycerol kinase (ATP)
MPSAYLVYNPAAGRFPSRLLTERAATQLLSHGWEIQLHKTQGGPHITQLARQAVDQGKDAFVIAGGDGSINFATAGLVGTETALGVLPAGTANVWAREIGLSGLTWTRLTALEEAARMLGAATTHYVDVGFCNDDAFLLWAGVGFDGFVMHRLEPRTRWEKHFALARYGTMMLHEASRWSGINLDVIVDDIQISGRYILGVASNIHLYAGGYAEISPSARLDDGVMDLWLFEGETVYETLKHALDLWSGRHIESELTRCIPFRKLVLRSDQSLHIQVDGEPLQAEGEVTIEVRSKAMKVLIPQSASRTLFVNGDL